MAMDTASSNAVNPEFFRMFFSSYEKSIEICYKTCASLPAWQEARCHHGHQAHDETTYFIGLIHKTA
jgi:hypothetical protein